MFTVLECKLVLSRASGMATNLDFIIERPVLAPDAHDDPSPSSVSARRLPIRPARRPAAAEESHEISARDGGICMTRTHLVVFLHERGQELRWGTRVCRGDPCLTPSARAQVIVVLLQYQRDDWSSRRIRRGASAHLETKQ